MGIGHHPLLGRGTFDIPLVLIIEAVLFILCLLHHTPGQTTTTSIMFDTQPLITSPRTALCAYIISLKQSKNRAKIKHRTQINQNSLLGKETENKNTWKANVK